MIEDPILILAEQFCAGQLTGEEYLDLVEQQLAVSMPPLAKPH